MAMQRPVDTGPVRGQMPQTAGPKPALPAPAVQRIGMRIGDAVGGVANEFLGRSNATPAAPKPAPVAAPVAAPKPVASPVAEPAAVAAFQPPALPAPAPKVPAPASAMVGLKHEPRPDSPVQPPTAGQLNASYDAGGYGPHSTEPQVAQARQAHAAPGGIGIARYETPEYKAGVMQATQAPLGSFAGGFITKGGTPENAAYSKRMNEEAAYMNRLPAAQGPPRPGPQSPQDDLSRAYVNAAMARMPEIMEIDRHEQAARSQENNAMYGNYNMMNGSPELSMQAAQFHLAAAQQRRALISTEEQGDKQREIQSRQVDGTLRNESPYARVDAEMSALNTETGRSYAEGKNQMAPGTIVPPNPADRDPDRPTANTQGLHNILHGDMPLHQKVAMAAAIPGVGTPGNPHQALFDQWMARQQATDAKWADTMNGYGNTGANANHPLSQFIGGNVAARNQKFHADMAKLGYGFGRAGGY